MSWTLVSQLALSGLVTGSILSLVALGFGLIYSASGHFHIAHIATITISGYIAYWVVDTIQLPFLFGLLATTITGGAFGFLVYRILYNPLERRGAERIMVFIVSLSLVIMSENLLLWLYGATPRRIVSEGMRTRLDVLGASLNVQQVLLIGLAFLVFAAITATAKKTKAGLLMRGVATNPRLLQSMARKPDTIVGATYFVGSGIASIAGFFLAADAGVVPLRGHEFFLPAAMAVILGGIGSFTGAFWLALTVGVAMSVSSVWMSHGWSVGLVFAIFVVGIVLKPNGLFRATGATVAKRARA